ncbi:MAG: HAMP domain-containing histidine kinase [Ignavibacteriales bacterium]|nr:HAMP domain-containing histidine kinase [Ignavibacteriales bacterium]
MELKKKNISLEVNVDKNTIVYADKNTILTVIRNLFSNAIKFCKDGDVILIFSIKKNNNIEISVSDSGVGMSEEDLAKLFRIDVHHTSVGTAQERGTGLGLILCKELLVKNNGDIKVESVLGEGTTFTFTLPEGTA